MFHCFMMCFFKLIRGDLPWYSFPSHRIPCLPSAHCETYSPVQVLVTMANFCPFVKHLLTSGLIFDFFSVSLTHTSPSIRSNNVFMSSFENSFETKKEFRLGSTRSVYFVSSLCSVITFCLGFDTFFANSIVNGDGSPCRTVGYVDSFSGVCFNYTTNCKNIRHIRV